MEIDKAKTIANWYNKSSHLDDVAYYLYIKHCDELSLKNDYNITLVDQSTFISLVSLVKDMKNNQIDPWKNFYIKAELILRNEKIEKILNVTNT